MEVDTAENCLGHVCGILAKRFDTIIYSSVT